MIHVLSDTATRLLKSIRLQFMFVLSGGILLNNCVKFDTHSAFVKGLILGTVLSATKLIWMERGINRLLSSRSYASVYAVLQISVRNILSVGLITCSVFISSISLWGVVAGMLLLNSSVFSIK